MKARLIALGGLAAFFVSGSALAQTNVTVAATVPSTVSGSQSSLVTDVQTIPADGSSRVTITVTLVDSTNTPVPNSTVKVTSNRGTVDTILCYLGSTLTSSNTTTADSDGIAKCVATSTAPGQATFSAFIDDQLTLDDHPVVTFTALPILQNLTITVTLPGGKKLVILQPPKTSPSVTPAPTAEGVEPSHTSGTGQLVSTGINVQISFISLIIFLFLCLLIPVLFAWILILIRRQRKLLDADATAHVKEQQSLDQIAQSEEKIVQQTAAIEQAVDADKPKPPALP